jgi:signal transduction histidine kinase
MATRILVVDDEPGIRDLLAWELPARGHAVECAVDGIDALGVLASRDFDLVITDIRMPRMDGTSLMRAVKERAPDTEVVVTTAHADLDVALACVRAGAFDLLLKPFELDELSAIVDAALERRQMRATTALYEGCRSIINNAEPAKLPQLVADVARSLLGADRAVLALPGANGRFSARPPALGGSREAVTEMRLCEMRGSNVPFLSDPATVTANGSWIGWPVAREGGVLGLLVVERDPGSTPFARSDIDRVGILASQITLALENAELLKRMVVGERLASIGRLAAGVAHEIRTPLSYLLMSAGFVRDELAPLIESLPTDAPPKAIGDAVEARGGVAWLRQLVDAAGDACLGARSIQEIAEDLRLISRRIDGPSTTVDLGEVARSALRVAAAGIPSGVEVAIDLSEDVKVVGNPGLLAQVILNLVVNASHALAGVSGRVRRIALSTFRRGDRGVVAVADTGTGIAPDAIERIFDPFFTTKGPELGTGLGLSISMDIARAHRGQLLVRTSVGVGTTFEFEVPTASEAGRGANRDSCQG